MLSAVILEELAATAELCGGEISPAAARMLAQDLEGFPEPMISKALRRCRRELKGRLTPEAIISRIDDGRPGPEEAWSLLPRDEAATAVWTEEMAAAYFVARPLLATREHVAARMAFRETYTRLVNEARDRREPARWSCSAGSDPSDRLAALASAVQAGRLPIDYACSMLAPEQADSLLALAGRRDLLLPHDPAGKARVSQLIAGMKGKP